MTSHSAFLELAAAAVDFPLSPSDRARLNRHLAECPACARSSAAFRSDAAEIAATRVPLLPERRGDEILRAVLRPEPLVHPLRLVLAVALLGLLMVGALVAGSRLLRENHPLEVMPPILLVSPSAGPQTSDSPAPSSPPTASGVLAVTHGDGSGKTWIETVDIATGATTKLGDGSDPAWMGTAQLAYTCANVGGDFNGVCFVRPADGKPSTVVPDADGPVPAPDNRRLVLHRGMVDVGETWIVQADGNALSKVTAGSYLQWSPDGTRLLGQPESSQYQVAVIGVDGSGQRVLGDGYDPAWSPDGASVAYAVVSGSDVALNVVDVATGASVRRYSVTAPREIRAPAWLPDGGLVFVLDGDLWRLPAGAGEPVRLTTGLAVGTDPALGAPVVSPDGRFVAFTTGSGDAARVGTASVDGGWTMLPMTSGPVTQPAWAPGATVVGSAGSNVLGDAWRQVDLPTTATRPITSISAVTAGGPGFVAVGMGWQADASTVEAVVLTSADGRTWTRAPKQDATNYGPPITPTSGPTVGMIDVAAGGPGIVAVGYAARPELRPTAWFSADGITWERTVLDDTLFRRVSAVTSDGTRFVIVGQDRDEATSAAAIKSAHGRAAVWTSTDGRSWTRVQDPALAAGSLIDTMEDPASGGMSDIAAGPAGLVGVGSTCQPNPVGCSPAVWFSTDGTAWQRATLPTLGGGLGSVIATPTGYVATGGEACDTSARPSGACPGLVLTSADGRTWTRVPFPQDGELGTITAVGDRLFLTAQGATTGVWVSQDGTSWAPAAIQGGIAPTEPSPEAIRWRLAARDGVAVMFAPSWTASEPTAWVSPIGK